MVFMVFVIMLLDTRDPSFLARYSRLGVPALVTVALLAAAPRTSTCSRSRPPSCATTGCTSS
jgi:NADH:ubiquinone oxidoreductase subunit 6 (subunit J)